MKRSLIITELKRRLLASAQLNTPALIEGDGGVWGQWKTRLPCIHIYEMEEQLEYSSRQKPGLYVKILPIQIDYISRLSKKDLIYSEGREKLADLQIAIELDERFKNEGIDLTIDYSMSANEIIEVLPSIVHVAVLYNFRYVENHFGYEASRH